MTGQIFHVNLKRGMYSIQVDHNDFIAFELLEMTPLEKGDIVEGNITGHGGETLTIKDTNEKIEVFIEVIGANEKLAKDRCFLT